MIDVIRANTDGTLPTNSYNWTTGAAATGNINWAYQYNEYVGTAQWFDIGNVSTPYAQLPMKVGKITQWRLRARFYTTSATKPARLLDFEMPGTIFAPLRYQWLATFALDGFRGVDKNNDPDTSPQDAQQFLTDAYESGATLLMNSVDPDMDGKQVFIMAPAVVKQHRRVEDGKLLWSGYVSLAIRETG